MEENKNAKLMEEALDNMRQCAPGSKERNEATKLAVELAKLEVTEYEANANAYDKEQTRALKEEELKATKKGNFWNGVLTGAKIAVTAILTFAVLHKEKDDYIDKPKTFSFMPKMKF